MILGRFFYYAYYTVNAPKIIMDDAFSKYNGKYADLINNCMKRITSLGDDLVAVEIYLVSIDSSEDFCIDAHKVVFSIMNTLFKNYSVVLLKYSEHEEPCGLDYETFYDFVSEDADDDLKICIYNESTKTIKPVSNSPVSGMINLPYGKRLIKSAFKPSVTLNDFLTLGELSELLEEGVFDDDFNVHFSFGGNILVESIGFFKFEDKIVFFSNYDADGFPIRTDLLGLKNGGLLPVDLTVKDDDKEISINNAFITV